MVILKEVKAVSQVETCMSVYVVWMLIWPEWYSKTVVFYLFFVPYEAILYMKIVTACVCALCK